MNISFSINFLSGWMLIPCIAAFIISCGLYASAGEDDDRKDGLIIFFQASAGFFGLIFSLIWFVKIAVAF